MHGELRFYTIQMECFENDSCQLIEDLEIMNSNRYNNLILLLQL